MSHEPRDIYTISYNHLILPGQTWYGSDIDEGLPSVCFDVVGLVGAVTNHLV